jgi:zinc transporter ZupT
MRSLRLALGILVALAGIALLASAIYGWARTGQCFSSNYYVTKVKPCPPRFVSDAAAFFLGLVLLPAGTGLALPRGAGMWWSAPGALVATAAGVLAVPVELGGSHPAKIVIGAILLAIAGWIVLGVMRHASRKRQTEALLRDGEQATALVTACAEPKFSAESDSTPRNVRLNVRLATGEPVEWAGRMRFPIGQVPDVGSELAVRVSADRKVVVFQH